MSGVTPGHRHTCVTMALLIVAAVATSGCAGADRGTGVATDGGTDGDVTGPQPVSYTHLTLPTILLV